MSDSELDDLDGLAGEYVLGTLAGDDRVQFEARLTLDPAAARAVAAWALRLQPMADAVAPAIPPANLWQKIVSAAGLPQRPSRRAWIALAAAAAAVVAAFFITNLLRPPAIIGIAQLVQRDGAAAFTVSVVEDREQLLIQAGAVDELQNQSYELWAVPAAGTPVSLGLISDSGETETNVPRDKRALLQSGVTLAVSLEPQGGSPTGAPTGPVLFTGALAIAQ
jgi:anti-sigma-K factor RskA